MEPDPDRSSGRASLQELSGGERGEKGEGLHCLDNAAIDEELCVHADQLLTAGGEGRRSGTTGPPIPVLWARNTTTATSMVVWLCNGSTPSTPVPLRGGAELCLNSRDHSDKTISSPGVQTAWCHTRCPDSLVSYQVSKTPRQPLEKTQPSPVGAPITAQYLLAFPRSSLSAPPPPPGPAFPLAFRAAEKPLLSDSVFLGSLCGHLALKQTGGDCPPPGPQRQPPASETQQTGGDCPPPGPQRQPPTVGPAHSGGGVSRLGSMAAPRRELRTEASSPFTLAVMVQSAVEATGLGGAALGLIPVLKQT
ncbi:unnamed protein product [Gadus morhua 'NCC']